MGQWYTFKCSKCDYEVISSGEKDCGWFAVVEPYICNDCREMMDVLIGETGKVISPELLNADQEKDYYRCHHCGGKNITKWNTQTKPCPKCGSRMRKDLSTIIDWD